MIKAILIDAMFTIWEPIHKDRYYLYRNFIQEALGRRVSISLLREVYQRKRNEFYPNDYPSYTKRWMTINYHVLESLFPDLKEEKILEMARDLTSLILSPKPFRVKRDTRIFLKQAKERGLKVIIASNNSGGRLRALLENFSLNKLIDSAYASSDIGLEKPDVDFFKHILKKESLKPEDCVMIGDNLDHDVKAPKSMGITGVLYNPNREHKDYAGYTVSKLTDVWQLDPFKS
ncbi:MAG: HAD family hydrolase [Candidatus Nealsonbacteria bacterium]|nr:HAD family hydrolase [Candidatus Nealsonbacteria bacterium]